MTATRLLPGALSLSKSSHLPPIGCSKLAPRNVAARPCKICDKAKFNRIGNLHEHDWQRPGLPIQCHQRRGSISKEHVGRHFRLARPRWLAGDPDRCQPNEFRYEYCDLAPIPAFAAPPEMLLA